MEAKAIARHVRVTPRKARRMVDLIRGKKATEAVTILKFAPQAAALPVRKTLESAIANARVKADKAGEYTSIESFSGKSVGAQTGTTKADLVTSDMPGANLVGLTSVNDLVNQLVYDKVDAIVVDGAVAQQYAKSNSDLVVADVSLGEAFPYCVAVQKGDPKGLLPSINATIAKLIADGKIEQYIADAEALSDQAIGETVHPSL